MLNYHEALDVFGSITYKLPTEKVKLTEAWHRVLAEEAVSDLNMPPFDKSAMDGFACKKADLKEPLKVIGMLYAGSDEKLTVNSGECVKIMTGAPLPKGADTVIMVEDTVSIDDDHIRFTADNTKPNYCTKGEDVQVGDVLLQPGTLLKPSHIAILASIGYAEVEVYQKPKVAVISTGTELVEPHETPSEAQIRNSNAYNLLAQLKEMGIVGNYVGILEDDQELIRNTMKKVIEENDMVIVSGGASFSEFDFVPVVLKELGMESKFEYLAIQPGRPVSFMHKDNKYSLGLAGNPVSTVVQFQILAKPFLYQLMGHAYKQPIQKIELAEDIYRKRADRLKFFPITIGTEGKVCELRFNGSAHIAGISTADGFGLFPRGSQKLKAGEVIEVLRM